jgi:hypothetical protein
MGWAARSQAALETFDLSWSGASFANSATATGTITFDTSLVNTSGYTSLTGDVGPATPWVTAFSMTISNASTPAGDGTFGLSDFNSVPGDIFMSLGGPVDFSTNLVGQANFQDFNVLTNRSNPDAPEGIINFTIQDASIDQLVLTSFAPEVTGPTGGSSAPLPSALPLGLLCLGTLAIAIRRHQSVIC